MSLNAYERETIIRFSDGDGLVNVWTSQRKIMTMLENDDRYDIINRTEDSMSATIPIENWSKSFGAKKRVSDEQREAMRNRAKERGFGRG